MLVMNLKFEDSKLFTFSSENTYKVYLKSLFTFSKSEIFGKNKNKK